MPVRILSFVALLVCLSFVRSAEAQFTQPSTTALPTLPSTSPLDRAMPTIDPSSLITDGPIDPAEYRLGPGDMLQLRIWTSSEPTAIMVSMDQKLLIPRMGEFDAKNKTLADLSREIEEQAIQSFAKRQAGSKNLTSLSLVQPRRVLATVRGEVESPGVYPLTSATRVLLAVEMARKATTQNVMMADQERLRANERQTREQEKLRPYFGNVSDKNHSERYISVSHSDGTTDRVDLVRYVATRDPKYCPLLREGDIIYVPFRRSVEGVVAIYGAIRSPGMYEFVDGDSLVGMIANAYGSTPNADLSKVELTRMSLDGETFVTNVYDLQNAQPGSSRDVILQRGDRIFVREKPDVRELSRVIVRGEVVRPGVYPISRTSTKLSEIITQAGGVTEFAHLTGAYISRPLQSEEEGLTPNEEALRLRRLANLEVEDTSNFRVQTEVRTGDVKVDMHRLLKDGDRSADVTLRDGDVIVIPMAPNTIYVWGYVGRMGYLPYVEGATYRDYVAAAGGYAEGAVPEGTRIIKAQTKQWMEPDETTIQPGDEIYVPKEGDFSEDYGWKVAGSIAGIVSGVALIVFSILDRVNN